MPRRSLKHNFISILFESLEEEAPQGEPQARMALMVQARMGRLFTRSVTRLRGKDPVTVDSLGLSTGTPARVTVDTCPRSC